MLSMFLSNANFHQFLQKIDHDLAEQIRAGGSQICGGALHRSNYPRTPLGLTKPFREYYEERESFCCDQEGCRKRATAPSVRFFGRYRFIAPVLILIAALKNGPTDKRCKKIQDLFGIKVSKKTWQRWVHWWRDIFKMTGFWKSQTGLLPAGESKAHCPRALLERQQGCLKERLVRVLQFLAPMTAGAFRAV